MTSIRETRRASVAQQSDQLALLHRFASGNVTWGDTEDLAELIRQLHAGRDANVVLGLQHARVGNHLSPQEERIREHAMFRMAQLTRECMLAGRASRIVAEELKALGPKIKKKIGDAKPLCAAPCFSNTLIQSPGLQS